MNRTCKVFSLLIISLTIIASLSRVSNCFGDGKPLPIEVTMYVNVTEIDTANHTVLADVKLKINGFPENTTTNVIVNFENDESYVVNCSLSGKANDGTNEYQGEIKGKYWYLVTYGELYPFDYNFVNFKLSHNLVGSTNGATYNPNWQYSLDVVDGTVNFSGFHWQDFLNTWSVTPEPSGQSLIMRFQRAEQSPQYMIIIPLMWFLTVVAFLPPLVRGNKSAKFQFYSSMLVFAPIFIFAVQGFIPPRNSLSIPEFLSFTLVLASTFMIIVTLPKYENEKQKSHWEIYGLLFSMVFSYFLGIVLYRRFVSFTVSGLAVVVILVYLTIVFGLSAIAIERNYEKYEQNRKRRLEEYNPDDFAH